MTATILDAFYPAPPGLPVPVNPPRGSQQTLELLLGIDWRQLSARNPDLLRAGAMWLHGFLDESHEIAQSLGSAEGSYWHALMHRSEPDFNNSKYWYRRVGRHAIFPALREQVSKVQVRDPKSQEVVKALLAGADWDPFRFVDLVELAARNQFKDFSLVQVIATAEYNLLLKHCLELNGP